MDLLRNTTILGPTRNCIPTSHFWTPIRTFGNYGRQTQGRQSQELQFSTKSMLRDQCKIFASIFSWKSSMKKSLKTFLLGSSFKLIFLIAMRSKEKLPNGPWRGWKMGGHRPRISEPPCITGEFLWLKTRKFVEDCIAWMTTENERILEKIESGNTHFSKEMLYDLKSSDKLLVTRYRNCYTLKLAKSRTRTRSRS